MPPIKLNKFGGMYPSADESLLPDGNAALSRDAYLYSGSLVGWRVPKQLRTLTNASARKAYRIPQDLARTGISESSYWLEFVDPDTDVIRSPVIDDQYSRYYMASPSVRPKYNTLARIGTASSPWYLGVPQPSTAPTVTPSGGTGFLVARTYVVTYVSTYGEEGPPSNFKYQTGPVDATWTIGLPAADSNDLGVNRTLAKTRVYRTITSASGTATYFLVAEVTITDSTYVDTVDDTTLATHAQLESTNWSGPPSDLQGIVQMANGVLAGFRKNEIWFSEPFRPHAWPAIYTLTVEFPIVGLGVAGQSCVVCTQGYPARITGVHPASMTISHIVFPEPCISRGSIVSTGQGVYYCSRNGLVLVSSSAAQVVTEEWIRRDRWKELTPPVSVRAVSLGMAYFAFGSVFINPSNGLDDTTYAKDGFTVDLGAHAPGAILFGKLTAPGNLNIYNIYNDFWTAIPLTIQDGKVWYYDMADASPALMPYLWRSKLFQMPFKKDFAAFKVFFSIPPGTTAQNVTRNISEPQTLAADQYGIMRVYADGVLVTTREIRTTGEMLRVKSGFKADFWQFEVEGRVNISNVQLATSVRELVSV